VSNSPSGWLTPIPEPNALRSHGNPLLKLRHIQGLTAHRTMTSPATLGSVHDICGYKAVVHPA
jgi:hypothetical protein